MQETKRVKNPRKQRKRLFNAPAHLRHKFMSSPLSNELAASRGVKTLPVRKGDTVRIQRGDNKGFEGKVSRVDLKQYRIYIEGLTREKVDGTNIFLPIHPSKVQIRNLNLDDKRRKETIARKHAIEKPEELEKTKAKSAKKIEKPKAKVEELEEKPVEVLQVEKAVPEIAKEVPEKVPETTTEIAQAKKTPAVEPTVAKKPAPKEVVQEKMQPDREAPVKKEKTPAKKTKKIAAAKKETHAKAAPKPRAKRKVSKEAKEGGQ
jgi:large subunit ribosomal protein L24